MGPGRVFAIVFVMNKTMRISATLAILIACLGTIGCMVSEQVGEPPHTLSFHFQNTYNNAVVYLRSAVLILVGVWLASPKYGKFPMLGIPLILLAAVWFYKGTELSRYRIDVLEDELVMDIPPAAEKRIDYDSIVGLRVEGEELKSDGKPLYFSDWRVMELSLDDGETLTVDLERLSMEQRQTLWQAVSHRAHLQTTSLNNP